MEYNRNVSTYIDYIISHLLFIQSKVDKFGYNQKLETELVDQLGSDTNDIVKYLELMNLPEFNDDPKQSTDPKEIKARIRDYKLNKLV